VRNVGTGETNVSHCTCGSFNTVLDSSFSGEQMTQPSSTLKNSRRKSNTWVAALTVGLVVGLGLGIVGSILFILPNMTQEVLFAINPVQVSGTVSVAQKGTISFINDNETTSTRYSHHVQIVDGNYSIVLSGGYSYNVYIGTGQTSYSYSFSLYVPSNVTTLTANFPP
jgi:hypothetical protein